MTEQPAQETESSFLGTLGWVSAVVLGAMVALVVLRWLGPLGAR